MIYVEKLRIDAYFSIKDVKRLKLLRDDYNFWQTAAPLDYQEDWLYTLLYCDEKISELSPR